ncbi:GntR family transcriptional regulator [Diaphorobacter sp. HDW4A]|uniref:GntR family transcriptional regulator n=1 Tax=Diaphorobacter sp. HDW4A TaxID=2714924 RepID=UPI001F0F7CD1|nr:GntR family transcriptional regulator [Diaphorobacter sp. HDW4A]
MLRPMPITTATMNLSNVSAQEEAYQYLLNAIRMGTLQPGSRIIAEDIATELDMSRMPIREALRRLSAEGLISLRTNRGAVVKKLSREEVCEIFEMRAVLEGLAASMAVKNATASDIKELELLLARLRAVQNDLPLWITAHREFHEKISALSRAPRILAQITSLHALIEPLMRVWIESSPESKNVNSVHERILEVMKSGDATEMEKLIKKHSRVTAEVILKSMF